MSSAFIGNYYINLQKSKSIDGYLLVVFSRTYGLVMEQNETCLCLYALWSCKKKTKKNTKSLRNYVHNLCNNMHV